MHDRCYTGVRRIRQPRDHAVPCQWCWTETWNYSAVCSRCTTVVSPDQEHYATAVQSAVLLLTAILEVQQVREILDD